MNTITRHHGNPNEHEAKVDEIVIPDIYYVSRQFSQDGNNIAADAVMDCLTLCHDLFREVKLSQPERTNKAGNALQEFLGDEIERCIKKRNSCLNECCYTRAGFWDSRRICLGDALAHWKDE